MGEIRSLEEGRERAEAEMNKAGALLISRRLFV